MQPDTSTAMARTQRETFARWLASGARRIGEITLQPGPDGRWLACHAEDAALLGTGSLQRNTTAESARDIARNDAAGNFRPLKTAPNLIRGWELDLPDEGNLRLALEFLYPAAIGNWTRWLDGETGAVPLRETLGRQSGMYRVTGLLTDAEAQELVASACHDGACRRRILWPLAPGQPLTGLSGPKTCCPREESAASDSLPLLCVEACNLLVAAARPVVKARMQREKGEPATPDHGHSH